MEFKKGDKVFVSAKSSSYGGKYAGMVGTVKYTDPRSRKFGVAFVGSFNPSSDYGWFYFYSNELNRVHEEYSITDMSRSVVSSLFSIKDVIFNDPAVIVLWNDGTKTVVKCSENDIFDPEKGLAMAISKKALGNQGNYYETFKKYLPEEEDIDDFGLHPEVSLDYSWIDRAKENFSDRIDDFIKNLKKDKNDEPHLCSTCKHLCQSLDSLVCCGCNPDKNRWAPAK